MSTPPFLEKFTPRAIYPQKGNYYDPLFNPYQLSQNLIAYQKYIKALEDSRFFRNQMKELMRKKHLLKEQIQKTEKMLNLHKQNEKLNQSNNQTEKRSRRKAVDIPRIYKCTHEECGKCYGSQGSLVQHIKLKHSSVDQKIKAQYNDFRNYTTY